MKRVFAESALPVMADESCLVEEDVPRCPGFFHGINIKLVKCGGMTPARRMIDAARRLGLKVMIGCMTESTVGISAIAQFLPLLDYVDMDGAALIARDVASGVRLEKGATCSPRRTATGCGFWSAVIYYRFDLPRSGFWPCTSALSVVRRKVLRHAPAPENRKAPSEARFLRPQPPHPCAGSRRCRSRRRIGKPASRKSGWPTYCSSRH